MARATHYQDDKDHILDVIHKAFISHAKPPTIRDLAEEIGVGVATMHSYLTKMADEGLVEWKTGHHRSLRLTDSGLTQLTA